MSELHTQAVSGAEATDSGPWLLAFHGIFGSGGNLRTMAKVILAAQPTWSIRLVDLPGHGRSPAGAGPHSIENAASKIVELGNSERAAGRRVQAVLGHSLGGKVALAVRKAAPSWLQTTVLLDSSPSARPRAMEESKQPSDVPEVLRMLESFPAQFASRDEFLERVTSTGLPASLAQWLAMNLMSSDGGFRLRIELSVMRALLADYYSLDLWSAVESGPGALRVIIGERSSVYGASERARMSELVSPTLSFDSVDAAHWLHAEKPKEVGELVARGLTSQVGVL